MKGKKKVTVIDISYKAAAAAAKSLQSCLTLCDPIDGSPPGSPVPGILQARTLEWVAISFSIRQLPSLKRETGRGLSQQQIKDLIKDASVHVSLLLKKSG